MMSGRRTLGLSLVGAAVAIVVVLVAGILATPASAASGTAQIGSASIASGSSSVDVSALNVGDPGLGAWSIDVTFDTAVVDATDCGAEQGGVCNPDFAADKVRFTGANAGGLEGTTVLADITFQCVANGTSALTLTLNIFSDATIGGPQPITATIQNGTFTCGAAPGGDTGAACNSFEFQEDAQAALDSDPSDPANLDANDNGVACEHLQHRPGGNGNGDDEESACAPYVYQELAQAVLDADTTDPEGLDPEHDGVACENLPQLPTVPGGIYNGSIAGGGTIQIVLDNTGRAVSSISISGFVTPCVTISQGTSVSPPVPLELRPGPDVGFSHDFTTGPSQVPLTVIVDGRILPNGTMEGTLTVDDHDTQRTCEQDAHSFVTSVAGAPAPPAPSGGVLGVSRAPNAGSGPGAISAGDPKVWLVAGLIGAGIAWLSTGIAGAGMSFVNGSRGPKMRSLARMSRPSTASTPSAASAPSQPAQPPAGQRKPGPFDAILNGDLPAQPARRVPVTRRRESHAKGTSWLTSARDDLRRGAIDGIPNFRRR
ncbi:MAG: cohesin domain-containing protein [Dehalococcoidia bacterium]